MGKFTKNFFGGRGGPGGSGWWSGVRVDVNEELKFLGGSGGSGWWEGEVRVCERRIEFFVKIQKKKWGGVRGEGEGWWGGGSGWM